MSSNNSIRNLEELRTSYSEGLVSALVGAGFSKNVYGFYPSWPQLLEDIVKVLYPSEYNKAKRESAKLKGTDKESRPFNELVNRLGPLNIVSEYIRYRGIGHESIDVYIEAKIPFLHERDGALYVKETKIEREFLSAHEALLNCKRFRNIYTTNYENLLEKIREYLEIGYFDSIICNSQELSNSLTKQSIIKVHGDLRTSYEEQPPYGFDGDKNLQYIISREDYESYQQKHEAFSFMMRMAMLQGKFCLVGFSGNDPNFQFWLQWMKDVLDKSDPGDIKVFLVDFYNEDLPDDVKLFYNNHRIGVINLLDGEMQNFLFPEYGNELEDSSVKTGVVPTFSRKELLTAFFKYLSGDIHETPRREQGKYYSLWSEAEQLISESKDINPILTKLRTVRETLGPQKRTEHQQIIINRLIRKPSWTNSETELFAIAVSDLGLLPFAFTRVLDNVKCDIKGSTIWDRLQKREDTLSGEKLKLEGGEDNTKFENALRLLYNLRFSELKELLLSWTPSGDYMYRMALLLGFFDKARAKQLINEYVGKEKALPVQKIMLAKQVANLIYNEFPGHYSLESYYDQGLSSFNEILLTINELRKNEQNKILPYSIEDHSICLNPGNRPFKESARLLSYLINWGYTTYYNNITCVPGEIWFGVFCELFEFFPFATLYYSSLYTDSKLLRRIGQEYAYSRSLHNDGIQKEVLQKILDGLGDVNTPWQNRSGLLYIASELYVAVKENEWYDAFKSSVLVPYLKSISDNTDRRDAVYVNVSKALDSIIKSEHVEECFLLLVGAISKNESLVTGLINNNLNVRNLKGDRYLKVTSVIIEKNNLSAICPVIYVLNYYGLLNADVLDAVETKASKEGIEFAESNTNSLIQLSFILSGKDNLHHLKRLILKRNIWDCGVREQVLTEPSLFRLERLSDRIVWTDEEIKVLVANLEKNLTLISERNTTSMLEPLFYTRIADILISMTSFYAKHQAKINNNGLQERIKNALNQECEMGHILKSLSSDEENHVFVAIEFVNIILSNYRIDQTFHELNVILNRALQKNKVGLALVLSEIRLLVEKHERDMWILFQDVLLQILNDYKDVDYRKLNLNLSSAYQYMNAIAKSARNQNVNDAIVDYWLTNEEVLRFSNVGRGY